MKVFIASLAAAIFGLVMVQLPGCYLVAMILSLAFSLLAAVLCFASAKNKHTVKESQSVYVVAGIFAVATAVAGTFRLSGLSNTVPASSGFDLAGWFLGAAVTIALSGAAWAVSSQKQRGVIGTRSGV